MGANAFALRVDRKESTGASNACKYYSGQLVGILFSAPSTKGKSMRHRAGICRMYRTSLSTQCEQCRAHQKIDAIVNSYGYSKI